MVCASCVACVCRVGARVTSDAPVGAEQPSKARFRETMYQLSLRFAQKWGVEQGRAYKALDVFRREVFRLSEYLRDDKPLLTWMHLCEAMVMEGLRELLDGIYPAVPEGEVTPEMAQKGIGSVGAVPLPEWLWQIYVSPRQEFLLSSAEEVRKVRGATADMLSGRRMPWAFRGRLRRLPLPSPRMRPRRGSSCTGCAPTRGSGRAGTRCRGLQAQINFPTTRCTDFRVTGLDAISTYLLRASSNVCLVFRMTPRPKSTCLPKKTSSLYSRLDDLSLMRKPAIARTSLNAASFVATAASESPNTRLG